MKLESLPSRSTVSKHGGYGVSVMAGSIGENENDRRLQRQGSITSSGPMSRLEASIEKGSEEDILRPESIARPRTRERELHRDYGTGIMRTTEVMISR